MELRHLHYFVAVVEAGSFTAAAERLHLSQPPLSVAIGKLEAEVGVALLERSHRGVEPTSAGRYLLDAASRVLGEVDEILTTLRRFGSGTAGTLRVAAVPVLMWWWLPQVLRRFSAVAPDVEVSLLDPPPWTALELLERGSVDVAAVMVADHEQFIARHEANFDIVDGGPIPLVAVLPRGAEAGENRAGAAAGDLAGAAEPVHQHPGAAIAGEAFGSVPESAPGSATSSAPGSVSSILPLGHFEGRTLLVPRRTAAVPSLPEAVDAALALAGVRPASIRTVETIQTILPLIEAGTGMAILPDPGRASLARFDVDTREFDPAPEPLRALVLTRASTPRDSRPRTSAARASATGASALDVSTARGSAARAAAPVASPARTLVELIARMRSEELALGRE